MIKIIRFVNKNKNIMAIILVLGVFIGFILGFILSHFINKRHSIRLIDELSCKQEKHLENAVNSIFFKTGKNISENYSDKLNTILQPFKDNIFEFKKRVETIHTEEVKQVGELKGQIDKMFVAQQRLSEEANNLVKALKGNVKQQGMWGEEILKRVLEYSGLKENIDYIEQGSYIVDGIRKQPDFIIKLPEERDIIIDSKLSLNSYVEYSKATPDEQNKILKDIKNSLTNHIDNLYKKCYYDIPEIKTINAVFIFIPIESLFLLLVEKFPGVFLEAAKKNIYITSPVSLMPLLKMIEAMWRTYKQNKNVMEMAKVAGRIYDKLYGILEDISNLKGNLLRADKNISELETKLKGKGNIISCVEKLSSLGANKTKNIPDKWLEDIDIDE